MWKKTFDFLFYLLFLPYKLSSCLIYFCVCLKVKRFKVKKTFKNKLDQYFWKKNKTKFYVFLETYSRVHLKTGPRPAPVIMFINF